MHVNVTVTLGEGETFTPTDETAAKAILKACGGKLATDTCQMQVIAPSPPVIVGWTAPVVEAAPEGEPKAD